MATPPDKSTLFPAGSLAPATAKALWAQFYDYVFALLGTSGTAADARTALGAASSGANTFTATQTLGAGAKIIFEGTTDDAYEITLDPGDPTADRTLVLPDKSGTLATTDAVGGSSFKNKIINGNFDIWQRGTSFSSFSGDVYTADRWVAVAGGAVSGDVLSQQLFSPGQTDVPDEPTYYFRFAAGPTVNHRVWMQRIEDVRTLAGQAYTLTFYAKASSATSGTVAVGQNFGSGGSGTVETTSNISLTTSWQKFTFSGSIPGVSGKTIGTGSYLYVAPIRWLGASNITIDIAQVQLEAGSVATPFEQRPVGLELALCKRYYEKTYNQNTPPGTATEVGARRWRFYDSASPTTISVASSHFVVAKRAAPTVVCYDMVGTAGKIKIFNNTTDPNNATPNLMNIGETGFNIASIDVNQGFMWHFTSSAEL